MSFSTGRFLCLILLQSLLIVPSGVLAQTGSLKGKVTESGKPVAFAQIYLPEISVGALSDEDGLYLIEAIPAGRYFVSIQALGFQKLTDTVEIKDGTIAIFDIDLAQATILLDEILIVDDQTGLTTRTPYSITTLSAKDVALKSNPSGLMGIIREVPGVYGAELGQGIVKPFIRGLGFSRVVTVYQGIKLENHQWGADHGLGVNDLGIGQVDIIKGPASILYGSGAIGGVILSKDDEFYITSERLSGNVGTAFNSVSGGLRSYASIGRRFGGDFFAAVEGAYENHADYVNGEGRIIGNSRFNTATIRAHAGLDKKNFKNKLSYTRHQQRLGIIEDDEMDDAASLATTRWDRKIQLPFQAVSDQIFTYRQTSVHEKVLTSLTLSHQFNTREEIEEDFDAVDLGLLQSNTFFNFRVSHKVGDRLENTFGVQVAHIYNRNNQDAGEILIPDARMTDGGVYYLGGLSLGKYYLQAGLRYDYRTVTADASRDLLVDYGFILPGNPGDRKLNRTFSGFTGSIGASGNWNQHSLRLNFATGFRGPDLAELFSNGPHPGTNRFEVGNAEYKREQSYQGDINYTFSHPRWRMQAGAFVNRIDNYLFFSNTGEVRDDGLEIWAFLQANALLYGAEGAFSYLPFADERLVLSVNAAVIRGKRLDQEGTFLTFIPADNMMFKAEYQPLKWKDARFFTTVRWVADQNRPGVNEEATPSYTLWNLGANHTFKWGRHHLTAGVHAMNILGKTYVDHMSILRAFNVSATGRNIMLSLQYRF